MLLVFSNHIQEIKSLIFAVCYLYLFYLYHLVIVANINLQVILLYMHSLLYSKQTFSIPKC